MRSLKRLIYIALAGCFILLAGSCTRNNGDIGEWFGTWQLTSIEVNGVPQEGYQRNYFWKFQNNIIGLIRVATGEATHNRDERYGTWEETDDMLILNFSYHDDENADGDATAGPYVPFPELHLPYNERIRLAITQRTGSSMTLVYHASGDDTYTYHLKKQS